MCGPRIILKTLMWPEVENYCPPLIYTVIDFRILPLTRAKAIFSSIFDFKKYEKFRGNCDEKWLTLCH